MRPSERSSLGAGSGFGSGTHRGSPSRLPGRLGPATHFLQGLPDPRTGEHQPSQASLRYTGGPSQCHGLPQPGTLPCAHTCPESLNSDTHMAPLALPPGGLPQPGLPPAPRTGPGPSSGQPAPLSSSNISSLSLLLRLLELQGPGSVPL